MLTTPGGIPITDLLPLAVCVAGLVLAIIVPLVLLWKAGNRSSGSADHSLKK